MRKQHCSFRFMFCKCKVAGRNLAATLWNASPIFDLVHRRMEALLKKELGTCLLKPAGRGGGGCISDGTGYMTDQGHIFVKVNSKNGARLMFDGEYASLAAIDATKTINVPKPIKVFDNPRGGAVCVMEYVDIHGLNKFSRELGEQLARLHLHNEEVGKQKDQQASSVHHDDEGLEYVSQFGFHITTCCGFIPQDNTWNDSWVDFFSRQKLQAQLELVEEKYHDSEARELWSKLKLKIPSFFKDLDIKPALLHGDLWGGNAGETKSGPVIFDPASFYGHHEYELSIAGMFGGFGRSFYDAYHKLIPKAAGFEDRQSLYQLFHYLNHWNHFGSGYRSSSIGIMRQLMKV